MTGGGSDWDASAAAWIRSLGDDGDYGRTFVLDGPMLERIRAAGVRTALDVGCGEGRFCRMLQRLGVATVGIDPTRALIECARERDPAGDYREGRAEALDLASESFDAVIAYLCLIDIPDVARAAAEMVRVLRPGGTLLIANLTGMNTAAMPQGWQHDAQGNSRFCIDRYLEERAVPVTWHGITVDNWHRPLSAYFAPFIGHGLILTHFAEPVPTGGDPLVAERYRRVPWFNIVEWRKPGAPPA